MLDTERSVMQPQVSNAANGTSGLLGWLKLLAGLAATLGWVGFGQNLGDTITLADPVAAMAVFYSLLFIPLILLAVLLGYLEHRSILQIGDKPGRWLLIGMFAGTGGFLITVAYAWLNGGLVTGEMEMAAISSLLLGVVLTLLQTGTEELVFRGWLQPALVDRLGALGGVILGAVLFAAFHMTAGVRAPLSLVNVTLAGALFGLLALRSGGIVASIAAHFTWNATEDLIFGLVPNPGNGALGSLFDYDLQGSPLWGGHEDGLNASIGTTAVLLALILPLLRNNRASAASQKETAQVSPAA
jgi:uncharacterized protein